VADNYTHRRVAILAVRWATAKKYAESLKRELAPICCERAEPLGSAGGFDEPVDAGGGVVLPAKTQDRPCWKTYRLLPPDGGDAERMPESEWCAPCLKREEIHRRYREATKARGALTRALQAVALRACSAWEGGDGG